MDAVATVICLFGAGGTESVGRQVVRFPAIGKGGDVKVGGHGEKDLKQAQRHLQVSALRGLLNVAFITASNPTECQGSPSATARPPYQKTVFFFT